jgi:hypothetical protein
MHRVFATFAKIFLNKAAFMARRISKAIKGCPTYPSTNSILEPYTFGTAAEKEILPVTGRNGLHAIL